MPVEAWLIRFVVDHQARFPRPDWPRPSEPDGVPFYRGWARAFAERALSEADLVEASERLAASPPRVLSDHLPALLRHASEVRREQEEREATASRRARLGPDARLWALAKAHWTALPEDDREVARAATRAANPALARFPSAIEAMCLDRMAAMITLTD